jgi:signal transduction histidine kinase
MMVVIVSIPMVLEWRYWRLGFLGLIIPWASFMLLTWQLGTSPMEMAVYGAANLFFGATGVLIVSLREEQARSKRLLREVTASQAALERAHRQLQASAATQQQVAVLEERQRLAREIHDSVAHGLTALVVQTQAARKLLEKDPARAPEVVAKCEEMAREALQETRRAVRALHPAGLEQQNDVEAIRRLARDYGVATEMQIEVLADAAAEQLPPDPERLEQIYRIAQEALTNAHRHGQAKTAAIELSVANHQLHMVVLNDGVTPESLDPGVGLRSMRERSHAIGGDFNCEVTEFGMTIRVTVPLKQEVAG